MIDLLSQLSLVRSGTPTGLSDRVAARCSLFATQRMRQPGPTHGRLLRCTLQQQAARPQACDVRGATVFGLSHVWRHGPRLCAMIVENRRTSRCCSVLAGKYLLRCDNRNYCTHTLHCMGLHCHTSSALLDFYDKTKNTMNLANLFFIVYGFSRQIMLVSKSWLVLY